MIHTAFEFMNNYNLKKHSQLNLPTIVIVDKFKGDVFVNLHSEVAVIIITTLTTVACINIKIFRPQSKFCFYSTIDSAHLY